MLSQHRGPARCPEDGSNPFQKSRNRLHKRAAKQGVQISPSDNVPILWVGQGLPNQDGAKPESNQSPLMEDHALV